MPKFRRSIFVSIGERLASRLVFILSVVVLARLLTPTEYGLFAIAAAVGAVASALREFGMGPYIVQEKELTEARLGTAFAFLLAFAWSAGALLWVAADPIARFYGQPPLSEIVQTIALAFFLSPFGRINSALYQRAMRFDAVFWIGLAGVCAQGGVGIALAWHGFGAVSLAWGMVANFAAEAIVAFLFSPRQIAIRPTFAEWRRVGRYGGLSASSIMLAMINNVAPTAIVGRMLGPAPVGYYDRAYTLSTQMRDLLVAGLLRVAAAEIGRRRRENAPIAPFVTRSVIELTAVTWPFYAGLALLAGPSIRILFGAQWDPAVDIARIMCAYGALGDIRQLVAAVFRATGEVGRTSQIEAIGVPLTVASVALGSLYGLEAVGWALVSVQAVLVGISLAFLKPIVGSPVPILLAVFRTSVFLSILAVGCGYPAIAATASLAQSDWAQVAVGGAAGAAGWTAGLFLTRHPLSEQVRHIFRQAAARLSGRR